MANAAFSRKKAVLFSLVPTGLLLVLLVATEFLLRVAVPSLDHPFVREVNADGIEWVQINRRYLTKYFPANQIVVPELRASVFRKVKKPSTFRIVCLGSSSMFGTPYEMNANIAAIVRKQLRHLSPEKDIEVINLGASAINSNVILDLFKQFIRFQPDLVLMYMGHNEFYGPDGVGASLLQREFPSTIPFIYSLRDLRIYRLFQGLLTPHGTPDDHQERNLMKVVSRNTAVSLASSDAERVLNLFQSNLGSIIHLCQDKHLPLIVSDLTSNLDFPPFLSDSIRSIPHWQNFCSGVRNEFQLGSFHLLRDTLSILRQQDSTNAFVNYWLGQTYRKLGQPQTGRSMLVLARDNDLLKFRAPTAINTIIRKLCASNEVPFFSSDSLFASLSPEGIAGRNLFWEHLHPTAEGYYRIATQFVHTILRSNYFPGSMRSTSSLLPWNTDSLSICWLDLSYADISMRNLTTNWPFSEYTVSSVVMQNAGDQLRQIALDTYMSKYSWSEGCYKSAFVLQRSGNLRAAQTTYEALLEDYPFSYYAHYLLGVLHKESNNLLESIHHYRRAIELNPDYPYARIDLGLLEVNQGKFTDAAQELQTALTLIGDKNMVVEKATIYYGLSAISANNGDMNKALDYVEQSLQLNPRYDAARNLRSNLLKVIGAH
ncbi:MAG: tetratricopeptide repeat protein [Ignavibacteriae bacterium]|nr:MAG: tetratricopeptide repeat protein [Ignavibacteriota bacterium]